MKNETLHKWLKREEPATYKRYLEYRKEKRREEARAYQRDLVKRANANAKKVKV